MQWFKKLIGIGTTSSLAHILAKGATVVDVRTEGEFQAGHAKGAMNIPLDRLEKNIGVLKQKQPLIVCCASGMRSSTATKLLNSHNIEAYNGGSWKKLGL